MKGVEMSPCKKCVLRNYDKDNNICPECNARFLYGNTLCDIDPPEIDMSKLIIPKQHNKGGFGKTRRYAKFSRCKSPGCSLKTMSATSDYCHKCHERRRQRIKRGIDPDLPVRGGIGNPLMARGTTRQKAAFDPVGT